MNRDKKRSDEARHEDSVQGMPWTGSGWVFGAFWLLLWLSALCASISWDKTHPILLCAGGVLLMVSSKRVALPRGWWVLAGLVVVTAAAQFLPAAWFPIPAWRSELERLGVPTGDRVVIQVRQALEYNGLHITMLLGGLLLIGHRPARGQLRVWSLVFTVGVAAYAIISKINMPPDSDTFGYFPSRNHTAIYLAMGAVCGLGCLTQAIRDRNAARIILALAAACVCLWAAMFWTISRGGLVLIGVGALIWLPMLGVRYLGRHGVWAICLLGLIATGGFLLTDSVVKQRLANTTEQLSTGVTAATLEGDMPHDHESSPAEFRIPTMLDAWDMIRKHPWSGVGYGQFYWVFPQYRQRSAIAKLDHYHPESDWLWIAAEVGVIAVILLMALTFWMSGYAAADVMRGHDRALRGGCLAAAALVPLHGIFDTSGHMIELLWSAAWLFALALRPPRCEPIGTSPKIGLRLAALPIVIFAGWYGWAAWHGQCAMSAGDRASKRAYAILQELSLMSEDERLASQPLVESGILEVDRARKLAPLHRGTYYMRGFLSSRIVEKDAETDHAFETLLALNPTAFEFVVELSLAWSEFDLPRTEALWREALRRADHMDKTTRSKPAHLSNRDYALHLMRNMVAKNPKLGAIYAKIAQ